MKERIQSGLQKRLDSLRGEKTKLRFIKTYGKKEYLESGFKSSVTLIKARLNMVEVKCNFKGNYGKNLKCVLCKLKDDTTEHLFECSKLSELQNVYTGRDLNLIEPAKTTSEYIEEAIKIRKINGFSIEFGK